jgi:hypothetical protein
MSTGKKVILLSVVITALPFIQSVGGIQTTCSTNPTFDVSLVGNGNGAENGDLWIAVLVPVTTGANFTSPSNNTMWAALGESGGSDRIFGSTVGNNLFVTASETRFKVTDFDTGQFLTGSQTSTVLAPGTLG